EEARFYHLAVTGDHDDDFDARLADVDARADAIGGTVVRDVPTAEALAKEYGHTPLLYDLFYRWNSQPTHGTLVGAGTFDMSSRFEWNELGGEGEWVEAEFWGMPFTACWEGAGVALPAYRDLLAPNQPLPSLDREDEFFRAMRAVPANYQAKR